MDYTFKNSLSGKACTILLTEYELTVQSAGKDEVIPYANITAVRLSRSNKRTYRIYLYPDHQKPLLITNLYYLSGNEVEDRSRQYVTFVRVLHMHLRGKSAAIFTAGINLSRLVIQSLSVILFAAILFFTIHYRLPEFANPFLLLMAVTGFGAACLFALNRGKLPKYYSPADIPLEFLP